jgi:hypothetical protein
LYSSTLLWQKRLFLCTVGGFGSPPNLGNLLVSLPPAEYTQRASIPNLQAFKYPRQIQQNYAFPTKKFH